MENPKVLVCLSTFNGEKYLRKQLDSIFAQINVDLSVLVRDDGSKDKTISILDEYRLIYPLEYYVGDNIKSAYSFLDIIVHAEGDFDYVALSDQDDIWLEDKLNAAILSIKKISSKNGILYASTLMVVDNKLNYLYIKKVKRLYNLVTSLQINNLVGCTMVLDLTLYKNIKKYCPKYIDMHDSWIYKVNLVNNGITYIDKTPHILYRQHQNNVIGARLTFKSKVKNYLQSLRSYNYIPSLLAKELYNGYKDSMSSNIQKLLINIINYDDNIWRKLKLLFIISVSSSSITHNLRAFIRIIKNKF